MPIYNQVQTETITNGGGTFNLACGNSTTTRYVFSGTATLAANWVIQPSGTPLQGMEFDIRWQSLCTQGANTVTIFGRVLSDDEALSDLTISCYYNGSAWDVDVTNNDLLLDTDSPVPFRGIKRTDSGDSSIIQSGIVSLSGWRGILNYSDSTGEILHNISASATDCGISYYRDLSSGLFGICSFQNHNDGVIGSFESFTGPTDKSYGFSTHNDTGATQADFFEYDPVLLMDTKYIFVTPTGIISRILYDIVDANNYKYNSFSFSDTEYTFGFGSTVVAGVETPSTKVFTMKLTGTTFNVIPSIPNYANDAAADADADLDSGALYTTGGSRTVHRKP